MDVYLRAKFEVSSIILTSFRQGRWGGGVILQPPTTKRTPTKPTQIRVKKIANFTSKLLQNYK